MGIAVIATIFLTVVVIFSDYRHVGKETLEELKTDIPEPEISEDEVKIINSADPLESV